MKFWGLYFLVACLSMAALAKEDKKKKDADEKKPDSDVVELTNKNFDEMIKKHEMLMVKFYAPWCGHCKQMAPDYEKLATKLKKSGSDFKVGKLDATVHMATGQKYKVLGYPTLKFFYKGLPIDYEGARENANILKFMEKKAGNPTKSVKTEEDIQEIAKLNECVVVGFFDDLESKNAKTFVEAARLSSYVEFAITSEKSLMKKFGVEKDGIVIQNNFPENTGFDISKKREKFDLSFSRQNIVDWSSKKSKPLLLEFNDQTSQNIMQNEHIFQHMILFAKFTGKDAVTEEKRDKMMIEFAKAGRKHKGKFMFVYADANDPPNYPMLNYFGRTPDDTPLFLIFNLANVTKFHAPEKANAITSKNMLSLLDNYLKGKAVQFFLSGKLGEDWDAKPLKYMVQSNFMNITHNKAQDAMVFYFSNECEHCGDKAAMMEELAEEFKDSEDKIFARINVSFNEFEDESLTTDLVPSIRIFKKKTNEMIEFGGQYSVDNLRKFLLDYDIQKPSPEPEEEEEEDEDEFGKHTEL